MSGLALGNQLPPQRRRQTLFRKGATAAEMTGVQANSAGDLNAFLAALITNTAMFLGMVLVMRFMRQAFPIVYAGRVIEGTVPFTPEETFFRMGQSQSHAHP